MASGLRPFIAGFLLLAQLGAITASENSARAGWRDSCRAKFAQLFERAKEAENAKDVEFAGDKIPAESESTQSVVVRKGSAAQPTLARATRTQPARESLAAEIAARRVRVPEFQFIREEAQRRGLRVWLFGGTAAGYAHYVKWDVLRELEDTRFQPNRFDYDYTNIYRSTQDLDIVVDGSAQDAHTFEQALKTQFPYFLGNKAAGWEVRSLKEAHGDKGGLLGDFGFMNQHTDSNSTGMVELTDPPRGELVVRDIRDFNNNRDPAFLNDVDEGSLTFYHSPRHEETARFKSGQNPPIFSAIRALTKAFQYDLKIKDEDLAILQREINQFDPHRDLANPDAQRWIEKNGKKLFQHAVNLEYAWNTLEKLGLRKKLIAIKNDAGTENSLGWWMSKEPLRTKPVGEGTGATAESLGLRTVAHETGNFLAFESMTRSRTGAPNVFVSRKDAPGEAALYGDGFYTAVGKKGAAGTGITIRYEVDPKAREGTDFIITHRAPSGKVYEGSYIIWRNKDAIRVIPESLDITPVRYFEFLAEGETIGQDDQALLWKLKRRLDHWITSGRFPDKDMKEIRSIVLSQIRNNAPNRDLAIEEWLKIEGARRKKDPKEVEALADSFKTKSYQVDPAPLFEGLTDLSRGTDLAPYVTQEWLPSILKTLKPDIGDRALEHSLFSNEPKIQEFGNRALAAREAKSSTPFVRALRSIKAEGGDAKAWLKSETTTKDGVQQKAAYLALHPELRQSLSEAELRTIEPAFENVSNLPVFEKLAGGRLPTDDVKSESFQFVAHDFPAGGKRVRLGSPESEAGRSFDSENQYEATLTKSFQMQATPVTQLQWALVMGENPSHFQWKGKMVNIQGTDKPMYPNRPVENVSWVQVHAFIAKLNELDPKYHYRLPTEAEWEYAARAGTETPAYYGAEAVEAYAWAGAPSGSQTHDVADLKPNSSGLYDMLGNVQEWVYDNWSKERPFHSVDPSGPIWIEPMSGYGVLRGGDWKSTGVELRSAARRKSAASRGMPRDRLESFGFRLVRSPK